MRLAQLSLLTLAAACGVTDSEFVPSSLDAGAGVAPEIDGGLLDPDLDTDGDTLPDVWEMTAAIPRHLDLARSDTNDNGIKDGDEDPDGDGLTNLEELALGRLPSSPVGCLVSPARKTIAVELDSMQARMPDDAVLGVVSSAFDALPIVGLDGSSGVDLCVYRDEEEIPASDLAGDIALRGALLSAHGARFSDLAEPKIPYRRFVHAMIVTRRIDSPDRGGDTLPEPGGDIERTGVLIYMDTLRALHPACGSATHPAVTLAEGVAGSLVHELGHTLQLGHDTEIGGGTDHWNVMSVQTSCGDAQMRAHGVANADLNLGNTEMVSAPRFSRAAAALMRFSHKLSAETALFEDDDGREM